MAKLDRAVIEGLGIPGMVLMETAARGVFRTALEILQSEYGTAVPLPLGLSQDNENNLVDIDLPARMIAEGRVIKIFCGSGNNGGDGMAVARMLDSVGAQVDVVLMCRGEELKGDARANYELAVKLGITIFEKAQAEDFFVSDEYDLVIDALLGTGMKGAARGLIAEAIEEINNAPCPVVSIDIPSGVEGSTGKAEGSAVEAQATPTMAGLKRGLVFSPGRELAGDVSIVDIGTPRQVVEEFSPRLWRIEPDDIIERLPFREEDTHKGECGRVFIIAGSTGLTGAACMAAEASVKSGAGLVVLGIPKSLNPVVEVKLTEAMSIPLPETQAGGISLEAVPLIMGRLKWATACGIGPGASRDEETLEAVRRIIADLRLPAVIDADALFALADKPESLNKLPEKSILTPHIGEFARLLSKSPDEVKEKRVELALEKAVEWETVILLKGSPTLAASPDGQVYLNPTGNAGMAAGGVGDVLTGVLAGLLGAGLEPIDAAIAGMYLHGLAGDTAAAEKGIFGMSATDLLDKIPETLKDFGC
ncbi:MAG: NAD(P)H-hydrate dehydratase [candidate division Zixibacteria bacterium]|nr:NAD(P)H-hydrate dehydratase [Candidatus Tariuqbacter arcticus]